MKKVALIVITAILFTIPSLCLAMDFQPLRPEMAAKIQALKQEARARGGTYEVAYSPAMEKDIEHLTGLKVPPGWNKNDAPSVPMLKSTVQTLPSSFDWRALNGVTPIKNQGNCGDCWAFGTVGPLESQILLQNGTTNGTDVILAEQYLLSCNVDGWSCNGGWWAHDYHMNEDGQDNNGPGAVLASADPYTGTDAPCGGTYNHPYKLNSWAYIASEDSIPTVEQIKQAIYTYGPISAAVYVGPLFQAYSSGIFNTSESGTVNHAIVLVGWNDTDASGDGYWILRNSWGTGWGQSGYMYIAYGTSQVGYAANFIEYGNGSPTPSPPATVTVPNVVNDTETAAQTAITGANLVVGTVTTQSSSTVTSGYVISETPAAGTSVNSGSAVNLVVSSGPAPNPAPPATVSVPNVVGDAQTTATSAITGAGLVVGTVTTQSSSTVASGDVISETPAAGTSVNSGSDVNLAVSSGPAPNPSPSKKADLTGVFENLAVSSSGRTLTGDFTVENIGTAATSTWFRVFLYLSSNGTSKTTLLGTAYVSNPIQPGGSVNLGISETFTYSVIGEYLIAVVDPDDRVPDSNRANNTVASNVLQTKTTR